MKHQLNIADTITASRIVFAVIIMFCPVFSMQFYAFYLLGGFSDMIDGLAARKLNIKSSFGAKLDSVADFVFIIVVLAKVLPSIYLPKWFGIWIAIIAFIKLTNLISSFVIFHRLISMHTIMNKITGFILFLLPLCVICGSKHQLLIVVAFACVVATFAAIQEGHFIRTGKEME